MTTNSELHIHTLSAALQRASTLLNDSPALAERQAEEILAVVPDHPGALLVLSVALRRLGQAGRSRDTLDRLAALQPCWPDAAYERGLTLAALGDSAGAIAALRRATELCPQMSDAWRALGDQYTLAGDVAGADAAYNQQIRHSTDNPVLMAAATALCDGTLAIAERQLKGYLKRFPTDVVAIRMLAELASRLGRYEDAELLLARCLELAPGFHAARHNHAFVLNRQQRPVETLAELDLLLAIEPTNPNCRMLKAAALVQIGEYAQAIALYVDLLRDYPAQPKAWMTYGHALKTEGEREASIAAYSRSIELQPGLGEAYWSLANLKTFRFGVDQIEAMRRQLRREDLSTEDRLHFHFALGKALEDAGEHGPAFEHYAEGNRIRRAQTGYVAAETTESVDRAIGFFTPALFERMAGSGAAQRDPIFVVGLPRSGSTLIEQILASHSAVEGTMELPDLQAMVKRLGGRRKRGDVSRFPEMLGELERSALLELGQEYLARTRVQRKSARPLFIDKMPNNFFHVGFIHLILPNARIVDARRHPLATCFSGFKQHFARGQLFSYDLADIGRYYVDYVRLMAHFDAVLSGRVHRVHYESMVADTEGEIRRLLEHCGLPFEESCLRYYANDRSVRTASAEQVRRPIFTEGLDQWRHYDAWLGPLKAALGPVLESYLLPPT